MLLRAQARVSFRALEQRGSLVFCPRVQAASISSSARLIAPSRHTSNPIPSSPSSFTFVRTMSTHYGELAVRPQPDKVVQEIADYVHNYKVHSDLAWETARLCLIDTIGCGLEGLRFPECRNLLGPVVEGTIVPNGCVLPFVCHNKPTLISLPQEPRSLGPITNSTRFAELSTSAPSSAGSTSTTASSLQNVCYPCCIPLLLVPRLLAG
jgi:MmgE/PrpD N-terminal domain